ncbi:MAG: peptidylprolyl isomerase, partial [Weeksellaceae bacterium]
IKHQKIAEKIASENSGNISLNDIAKKYGSTVTNAQISFNQPSIAGQGVEPKVAGAAMGLAEGKTSNAIEGNNAVYFISVKGKSKPSGADLNQNKQAYKAQMKNKLSTQLIPSLIDAADVDDNRAKLLK